MSVPGGPAAMRAAQRCASYLSRRFVAYGLEAERFKASRATGGSIWRVTYEGDLRTDEQTRRLVVEAARAFVEGCGRTGR